MAKRKSFYSFHFDADNWRAGQVRNIGAVEGNTPVSDNDWEQIKRGGDAAIQRWIDGQMSGRPCTIVLIGRNTANRKWVNYEIKKSWEDGKGLLGIYIHNLLDRHGHQTLKGSNPFDAFTLGNASLSRFVSVYDPPYTLSTDVYGYISKNLSSWVEQAIAAR
jgi:hypothetical protein